MDVSAIPEESMWARSPYGCVYAALSSSFDPCYRGMAPGTEAEIGRAIDRLRTAGDAAAISRLEKIALTATKLRQSLGSNAKDDYGVTRAALGRLAGDWLAAAPMFPTAVSGQFE
jgi:hypothetical protein